MFVMLQEVRSSSQLVQSQMEALTKFVPSDQDLREVKSINPATSTSIHVKPELVDYPSPSKDLPRLRLTFKTERMALVK